MCGIFGGHVSLLKSNTSQLLSHRGPDQQEQITLETPSGPFILGQTRLNIVDRHTIDLPFSSQGATILFNGEIYNWKALRKELEKLNYIFKTDTDIEVALYAYLTWGSKCLDKFNGMFAFAIWHNEKLFLARDRLGKKPLFYQKDHNLLAFASELKCFTNLKYTPVSICENLEFYFDQYTPFSSINCLRPGEYLEFCSRAGTYQQVKWWDFPEPNPIYTDLPQAIDKFIELFTDACNLRQQADVPVSLFLSGGLDSTLIQAILKLPVTYTCQFEEFKNTINEEIYVKDLASKLNFEARFVRPTKAEFQSAFSKLAYFIEFPVGSFTVFPLYCLNQQAHKDQYKVVLSGEGADELFNGYFRHELLLKENQEFLGLLEGDYASLCKRYYGTPLDRFCRMASRHGINDLSILHEYFKPFWKDNFSFAYNLCSIESKFFLQALLTMADRMSMAHSIEIRNPFLDYRIVEFSTQIPDHFKFRENQGKWFLRQVLAKLIPVDSLILQRKVKHGLPSPINLWIPHTDLFDRRDWNNMLFGECLRQLSFPQLAS